MANLESLFHHRWTVPILAVLHRENGAKFVTLLHRLNLSRDSLTRTLHALLETGWVIHNAGHGHPLRPEYVLSETGTKLGVPCTALAELLSDRALEDVALKKWSMPVLLALYSGTTRFSDLKKTLPTLGARALTLALKDLVEASLVKREVFDDHPPTVAYHVTSLGKTIAECVEPIAHAGARRGA